MKRREKIRLIKGLIRGSIVLEDLNKPIVEVWIQEIRKNSYKNINSGEIVSKEILLKRKMKNLKIIRLEFVEGKTIL